jgi:hypothetical protein
MAEHRGSERGLFDKLQLPEHREARDLLERLLDDSTNTYERICITLKSSGLFEDIKEVKPQDLSRYRQRRERAESRARVMRLIEEEGEALLGAATKNPTGLIARYLRQKLTEHAVSRFDEEVEKIDAVQVSKETARHALVEQRDRKLDLDAEKLRIEERRLELQRQQQELQRDKFGIAAKTWQFILSWFATVDSAAVDRLTKHSDKLLSDLEGYIETNG